MNASPSEAIRPGDKGLPVELVGQPLDDLVGRTTTDGTFPSPSIVVRNAAVDHNIATMAAYCREANVKLAPHGKTTMSSGLFRRQLDAGAWGITVATASQGRAAEAAGVRRILVANQIVDRGGLQWITAAADRGIDILLFVDSADGLDAIVQATTAGAGTTTNPVNVLLEVGVQGGRTGFRHTTEVLEQARRLSSDGGGTKHDARRPVLAGVAGYEGVVPDASGLDRYLESLARAFELLAQAGLFNPHRISGGQPVLTAGGSAHFDRVAAVLGRCRDRNPDINPTVVLRSGCYVTHDHGLYQSVSPLDLQPALEVRAVVQSRPEPTLALLNVGRRDVSHDAGLPVVLPPAPEHWRIERLMDQHAFVTVREDDKITVGQTVPLGISHPCTTFDKWRVLPVVDEHDVIVDVLTTTF